MIEVSQVVGVFVAAVVGIAAVKLNRQLNAIHELVNSNLSKAQAELAVADRRIQVLEEHIAHEPGGSET
jgi:hypothetical protein